MSVLAVGLVSGCGGASESAAPTTTAAAPTYSVVPAAEVTAGLAEVQRIAGTLEATRAKDEAAARVDLERMYERWYEFEGTVRANDKDLYLQMEDGLGSIKIGVQENRPDRIVSGIADLAAGVTAYRAANP